MKMSTQIERSSEPSASPQNAQLTNKNIPPSSLKKRKRLDRDLLSQSMQQVLQEKQDISSEMDELFQHAEKKVFLLGNAEHQRVDRKMHALMEHFAYELMNPVRTKLEDQANLQTFVSAMTSWEAREHAIAQEMQRLQSMLNGDFEESETSDNDPKPNPVDDAVDRVD